MSTTITRGGESWLKRRFSGGSTPAQRQKSRLRRNAMRRLEVLEDRTLLNASLDIDAAGNLLYKTDNAVAETLNISLAGGTYTFASSVNITVTNASGLTDAGGGTNTVTITGGALTTAKVEAHFDNDAIGLRSMDAPTTLDPLAANFTFLTVGDSTNPLGLGAITGAVTVAAGTGTNNSLTVDDSGSTAAATAYTLTSTTLAATNGFGGLTYTSTLSNLLLLGSTGANSFDIQGTAAGVATTVQGGTGASDSFVVSGASSGLVLIGGGGANTYDIQSATAPMSINGGGTSNAVTIGNPANPLGIGAITGLVTLAGIPADSVTVDDTGSTAAVTNYGLSSAGLGADNGFGGLNLVSAPAALALLGSNGANFYEVDSNSSPVTITTGTGVDSVTLGDALNVAGIGSIGFPITVVGSGNDILTVNDTGSLTLATAYGVTATTVTANNGFGGLTYSGVNPLSLFGSNGNNAFNISGTADGITTSVNGGAGVNAFDVTGTSADPTSNLVLGGGGVFNTFTIQGNSSPVLVLAGPNGNNVQVGNGDTSGIGAEVVVRNLAGGNVAIDVDNSLGATGGDWLLEMEIAPSTDATLTGFGGVGPVVYDPTQINALSLRNAIGQANSLTVDFFNGNPIPGVGLSYDGGAFPTSNAISNLILTGGAFTNETHDAFNPDAGHINLDGADLNYSGVSQHSVYDVAGAVNYTFNNLGSPANAVVIMEGANNALTGNAQALLISSASFVDTHVANKTNVTVNNNAPAGYGVIVDYGIAATVAGLASLTVNTDGGDDSADLIALPPGVATSVNQDGGNDHASVDVVGVGATSSATLDGGIAGHDILGIDAGGLAITPANFADGGGGVTIVSGAPLTGGPINYLNYEHVYVTNLAPQPPVVTANTIDAIQGTRLINVVVGTFTSAAVGAKASDFTATIDWGDGSPLDGGVIVQDDQNPSVFHVIGSHTYTGAAGPYATTLSVSSTGSRGTVIINGVPVTFVTPPSGPVTANGTANVIITDLPAVPPVVTATDIFAVQGQRLVDAVVGSFTSAAPGAKAGDFGATINWGDGSAVSAGTIVQDASNPYVFYVMGTHTYHENSAAYTTTLTVTSSGSSLTTVIGGIPVTTYTPASGPVADDATAVVDNAPIDLTVSTFAGVENVTPSPLNVVVATFVDQGGVTPGDLNPTARYVATINWGDGSGVSTIPTSAITRNGTSNSYFITLPQHVYSTPGNYVVTVTVSDGGPLGATGVVTQTATGVAHVADAVLTGTTPQPAIVDATEDVLFVDKVLASFTDANPLATVGEYSVTIDWGDGSPLSYGRVIQPGGVGSPMFVVGSHTYADALRSTNFPSGASPLAGPVTANGTYPIRIFVQDTYGSAVNLFNTIEVLDRTMTVTGELNPLSDSGVSDNDDITNVRQPTFFGRASEAGALVFLYATANDGGIPALIGQATAGATGEWSITSGVPLADGGYKIEAQAYDASGNSISAPTTITSNLVIDTVGPQIADVYLDNFNGQVIVTYQDLGGVANAGVGMLQSSLVDANNYRFSMIYSPVKGYKGAPQWLVTSVDVVPGTNVGDQVAYIQINNSRPIRGGHYRFDVLSVTPDNLSGVRDIAGNALDGEFYSYFNSGNNVRGGSFMSRLDAVHNINFAPRTLIGPATPVTPPGRPGVTRVLGRGLHHPRATAANQLAARNAVRPAAANLAAARAARPGLALAAARPRLAALRG